MSVVASPAPAPQPLCFGPAEAPMFGWWHPPAVQASTPAPRLAVLLCAPLGHEDLATHPSLRRLAVTLAAAGLPVLRYDHPGCGDSAELTEPEQWPAAAQQAVHWAADVLKRCSGVDRLALVGLRMGALLAAIAAAQRQDVQALVAILPVQSGRAWLRECRLLDGRSIATAVVRADPAQGLDLGGLVLGPAPAQALANLAWPAGSALPPVLWIERDDLPSGRLAETLRQAGAVLTQRPLAHLDRVTAVAHLAHTPEALYEEVSAWLHERLRSTTDERPAAAASPGTPPPWSGMDLPGGGALAAAVTERLVCLNDGPDLVGVLSLPAAAADATAKPRRGLLLLSSGAERRVGPNRTWVPFARARAARGDVVLRLDLGGLGDSDPRDGSGAVDVYDPRCADDIARALAWLRRTQGVQDCAVAGVCSGGYHAWRAALGDLPLSLVVPINPLVFHWRAGMSLDPSAHAFGRAAVAGDAMRSLRDPQRWLKLLRGKANLRVIGAALVGRLQDRLVQFRRALTRRLGRPSDDDLAADLQHAVRRGVRLCFVFSEDDPGPLILSDQGGAVYRALRRRGQIEVRHLPGADHTLSHQAARLALWRLLDELLDRGPSLP